ncbi:MAG: efflux RND transporter permease subunit [Candidatus Cloacimonetes bacterium]|nr:efflux RND transporter permease subunit [Candidatus Cloacimonadota bacterium]
MNLAKYSINNRVVIWMFVFILAIGGMNSYNNLSRLEDPEFTIKEAVIVTYYKGATPKQVELEVTDKIEESVQQMRQLEEVRSISKAGMSIVYAKMKDQYGKKDLPLIWNELRNKVGDSKSSLPSGVQGPFVNDDYGDVYGVFYALTGDGYSMKELEGFSTFLKRELLLVKDVASIDIMGVQQEAIYVELSSNKLSLFSLTQNQIFSTLQNYGSISDAGEAKLGSEYIKIFPTGNFNSVEEIKAIKIRGVGGVLINLSDIANVYRSYADPSESYLRFNKKDAIGFGISTMRGGNVVTMGDGLSQRLQELQSVIPAGMEVNVISHQAESVKKSVSGFIDNLSEAVLIVIGVLLIFMGLRSGLLIGSILLLTIASTFVFMNMFSITLERISLGALIIALGMLVDNAIVVTEGILIQVQQGKDRFESCIKIVKETILPLLGATIIAVLAFSGIGLSPDSTGEYCRSLFYVILISLMMSWVLAITVTPMFCYLFLKEGSETNETYNGLFFVFFTAFLKKTIRFRYVTMGVMTVLLFSALYAFRYVPESFFPSSTRAQFMINVWQPQGRHIDEVNASVSKVEDWILKQDGVKSVASFVGSGGLRFMLTYAPQSPNRSYGQLLVSVDDYSDVARLISEFSSYSTSLSPDILFDTKTFALGPGSGGKIAVRLSGDDENLLREYSQKILTIMRQEENTKGVRVDWGEQAKILQPHFNTIQGRKLGITRKNLSATIKWAMNGQAAVMYRERNKLIPIISRPPKEERGTIEHVKQTKIWSQTTNSYVPLDQVVDFWELKPADAMIRRLNQKRTMKIQCDPITGVASKVFYRLKPKIEAIDLPEGLKIEWAGEYEDAAKAQGNLAINLPLSFLAMIVALVVLFGNIRFPLIILCTLPLSIIGVSLGLVALQQPFDFMSLLGFLSLSGMVIKNSIVLLEQIQLDLAEGKTAYNATIEATVSRIRPVAMAAITTVLGMIPLLTDGFFRGMAITIMGGLSFATVLTLIVIPCLYCIFYNVKEDSDVC